MSLTSAGVVDVTVSGAGGTVTGSGISGQVALWTGVSVIAGDAGFTWTGTGATLDATVGRYLTAANIIEFPARLNSFTGLGTGNRAGIGTASNSTGAGHGALAALTDGSDNTGVGESALAAVTTGGNNTAVGSSSLRAITTSSYATALGTLAGRWSASPTTGSVFVGYNAGPPNLSSYTSTDVILIGRGAEQTTDALANAIGIGATVSLNGDNRVVLGNGSVTDVYLGSETPSATLRAKTANFSTLPAYADNTAALGGGLVAGDLYVVTASDPRQIAVVF